MNAQGPGQVKLENHLRQHLSLDDRRKMERSFEAISPFEFKNELIRLASEKSKQGAATLLNAGRGNPNWIAATPREMFFMLGNFALEESKRVWSAGHLAGKPSKQGIAERMHIFLNNHETDETSKWLRSFVEYGNSRGFPPDDWVFELVDGIIGDNYPEPDRMLTYTEKVVHDFLIREICQNQSPSSNFELFAVEGATAAMCYLFNTLLENHLLNRGDKIAIAVPIFPPYVEIPELHKYNFHVINLYASGIDNRGEHTWQYPKEELDKLKDPSVKALFLVNPSNPPSVAMSPQCIDEIAQIIHQHNRELIIISDDVYATFVDEYCSLLAKLPRNTIGVYSLSKYFGVTGWRLGVIAIHPDHVLNDKLGDLPDQIQEELANRYRSLTQHPEKLSVMERLVADSREVALNHTAGLSTPQQIQMAMFTWFALTEDGQRYKQQTRDICRHRMALLYEGLGLPQPNLAYCADYYTEFDLEVWAKHHYGDAFFEFLAAHYEPVDILFRLAEQSAIVLLNGGGFAGPKWSIRVSLANLNDEAYSDIGKYLHQALESYVAAWRGQESPNGLPSS
ncbi:aspartate 4-decarboxylase [Alicyclobacillus sp. TC]|uniref:aspartate 4-decarboxylase n=1 Tax=Alicyclobacillus sp. TC TaxID=2606450 RepID=UPI001EE4E594|nr:aspartate 4-decarboxylase [Alicyclobacillus sp. TC]